MTDRPSRVVLLLLLAVALAPAALAQEGAPPPLTLERAVDLAAGASADVLTARATLAGAEADLALALADPLAVRMDQLQAEHAVAAAQEGLRNTQLAARIAATTAYTAALEAADDLAAAEMRLDIARTTLEAQELRFAAGVITALDLERARNDLQDAQSAVGSARTGRDLAIAQLERATGAAITTLAPVGEGAAGGGLPTLAQLLERATNENGAVLAAGRAVELAAAQLAAVDNAFSSRQAIDAARAAFGNAELRETELRRNLELSLQGSRSAVQAAQNRYDGASTALTTATAEMEAQTARFEAGTISLLAHRQAELQHAGAVSNRTAALHALVLARLRLEQAVLGQ